MLIIEIAVGIVLGSGALRVISAIIEADRNNPITKQMKYWAEYDRSHPEGRPCVYCGKVMSAHFNIGRKWWRKLSCVSREEHKKLMEKPLVWCKEHRKWEYDQAQRLTK